ncbi:cold shock domain-containing protein [Moraxella nonliquefaciens]|uniref:cold-shock protein n=1 Tax=Moraxella nonliquefaciens TaxID=478 RepID=UPI0024A74AEE|nr:cold shock domain-containing protein [Moraxella nonliquefaciens]MDI4498838.1 cold shock domain-containing protein [Moraxella nonliquefaciens]MDI4500736.1 cold shock domain-containing protein [Moraxella nonliquefaciens]
MSTQKYIGMVLWFGTADGAKYGFIEYKDELGKEQSIFFHKNKISKPSSLNLDRFTEGQTVTFLIKQSDKEIDKNEAYNILILEDEQDEEFLLLTLFLMIKTGKSNKIYKNIYQIIETNIKHYINFNQILDEELSKIIEDDQKLQELSIFFDYIDNNPILYNKIINSQIKTLFYKSDYIFEKINGIKDKFSKDSNVYKNLIIRVINELKSEKTIPFDKQSSLNDFINISNKENFNDHDIFHILKKQNIIYVKDLLLDFIVKLDKDKNLYFLNEFIEPKFFQTNFQKIRDLEKLFDFIKNNDIETSYYQTFYNLFSNLTKENINYKEFIHLLNLLKNHGMEKQILSTIHGTGLQFLLNLFFQDSFSNIELKIQRIINQKLINQETFDLLTSDNKILEFFERLEIFNLYQEKENFIKILPIYSKILLWINDIISFFDYELYVKNIIYLDTYYQQIFIKKILYMIAVGDISKNLNDITSIDVNDYSTKIIFNLLNRISKHEILSKNFLKYDLLSLLSLDTLIDSHDILRIHGYFDLCHGRTCEYSRTLNSNPTINNGRYLGDGNQIDEKQYFYVREDIEYHNQDNLNPIICDGRWSIDKDGNLNLSNGKYHYLWCRNKRCFETTRISKNLENWKEYSLIDFLNILKIPYHSEQIEILYATINHINRFLSHMNCKSCGQLLKPKESSNYSFYRVNSFDCTNDFCENPDKDVYISHCSNGYCSGTIDSRNSGKCNNGWVICSECFACCDKERLDKRNSNRLINGLPATNWATPNGHCGYNILCPNCTSPMIFKDIQQKQREYDDVIQDFEKLASLDIPQNKKLVGKHGVNSSSKRWFVVYKRHLSREEFLNHLYYWQSLGFNIVDFEDKTKLNYLITEPNNDKTLTKITHFHCQSCNHSYDYTHEQDKYRAVKYWHSSELTII